MTTGERVPHFAEVDTQAADTPDAQALFIRPAQRLIGGHHYAVAITNRVKRADGGELPSPPGFAALRDGKHDRPRAARGDAAAVRIDVLAALETAGVAKAELVLAWDFTVASDDFLHREMIAARDRALAALVESSDRLHDHDRSAPDPGKPEIARHITGKLEAPLFLNSPAFGVDDTTTVRDAEGLPVVQGFYQIPFAAIVPACAYTSADAGRG